MTTGKTIALTRWIFVDKVMSLLYNMLSRLVITFLPRSKRLLISWLQSLSAVILEPPKNKVWHCFHCSPIYFPWSDGTRCCHPTISSSVVPFSSCPQSFLASGYFPMSQLFTSGGQRIGVSASTSVLPMNEYAGLISFRMDWLDLLAIQGTLKSLVQQHGSKASVFGIQLSL